ncbi:hypothetical protein [Microbacterium sp. GXF0217]
MSDTVRTRTQHYAVSLEPRSARDAVGRATGLRRSALPVARTRRLRTVGALGLAAMVAAAALPFVTELVASV